MDLEGPWGKELKLTKSEKAKITRDGKKTVPKKKDKKEK